jgi:tetratricopeptide (TPR) repeat protein
MMQGPCKEAREAIDLVDHDYSWYFWAMYIIEAAEGNYDAAFQLVDALPDGWDIRKTNTMPASLYRGFIYNFMGDSLMAQEHFRLAVKQIEKELPQHPDDARYHSAMGMALAGIGEKERAVQMGVKATELTRYSEDSAYGVDPIYDLAVIYTLVGDKDKAFEQIEFNLSHPGHFSVARLKADKLFDSLRSDSRYRALIQKYSLPEYAVLTQVQ